jgi:hypothetical protein
LAVTHHSKGPNVSAGIDVGDKYSHLCLITQDNGDIIEETRLRTTKPALKRYFDQANTMRIAIEAGPRAATRPMNVTPRNSPESHASTRNSYPRLRIEVNKPKRT